MGAHQRLRVQRRKAIEQGGPQDRNESGRDQQLREPGERVMPELSASYRLLQAPAHDREHARDHLPVIELGEFRETLPFADDQRDDVLAAGAKDLRHEYVENHLHQRPNGKVPSGCSADGANQRAQARPYQLLEQGLFVAEIKVKGAFGDACPPGNVIEPGCGKSTRGKLGERRIENSLAPFGAPVLALTVGMPAALVTDWSVIRLGCRKPPHKPPPAQSLAIGL
jgi:hypothetical protein